MRMDAMMRKDAAMRGKLLRFGPAARAARFSYVVRQQMRIPSTLDCLKAGSYLHSYQSRYSGMHRDCHGYVKRMQRELHGMYMGSPREYYKTRECGHTSSYECANALPHLQLRMGELHSHSTATNGRTPFALPSYEWANKFTPSADLSTTSPVPSSAGVKCPERPS